MSGLVMTILSGDSRPRMRFRFSCFYLMVVISATATAPFLFSGFRNGRLVMYLKQSTTDANTITWHAFAPSLCSFVLLPFLLAL